MLVSQGKEIWPSLPPSLPSPFSQEKHPEMLSSLYSLQKNPTPKSSFCWEHKWTTKSLHPFFILVLPFCNLGGSCNCPYVLNFVAWIARSQIYRKERLSRFLTGWIQTYNSVFLSSTFSSSLGNINHGQHAMLPSLGSVCVCLCADILHLNNSALIVELAAYHFPDICYIDGLFSPPSLFVLFKVLLLLLLFVLKTVTLLNFMMAAFLPGLCPIDLIIGGNVCLVAPHPVP